MLAVYVVGTANDQTTAVQVHTYNLQLLVRMNVLQNSSSNLTSRHAKKSLLRLYFLQWKSLAIYLEKSRALWQTRIDSREDDLPTCIFLSNKKTNKITTYLPGNTTRNYPIPAKQKCGESQKWEKRDGPVMRLMNRYWFLLCVDYQMQH